MPRLKATQYFQAHITYSQKMYYVLSNKMSFKQLPKNKYAEHIFNARTFHLGINDF